MNCRSAFKELQEKKGRQKYAPKIFTGSIKRFLRALPDSDFFFSHRLLKSPGDNCSGLFWPVTNTQKLRTRPVYSEPTYALLIALLPSPSL